MPFSKAEKEYIKQLLEREIEHFKRDRKTMFVDIALPYLKGDHEYVHFLEGLMKKL